MGERVYHLGERAQLTLCNGEEVIDRIVRIKQGDSDCTSEIYFNKDPTTPHSLGGFQEFQTLGIRIITDGSKLALFIGEKNKE